MTDLVQLKFKRNRGWPWPEVSFGLTPMYGEDGWCHACGVPNGPQTGSLVLQRKSMRPEGGWVPYWHYDSPCVGEKAADAIRGRFAVELREVQWHASSPGRAFQILIPVVGERWFAPEGLEKKGLEHHGRAGAQCADCGVWRWVPLDFGILPPMIDPGILAGHDVAASPEWFGDGLMAFRQWLMNPELAAIIAEASPRDFVVKKPVELTGAEGTDPVWHPGGGSS
ncbi:hypothetical protein G5T42_07785 [Microbacterium sp. 4R-513]|uniref:hypothetical protein n=1 Tax=Microbacterium sp. 4R-513 TaxID=2567934 RepID=UPI0013E0EBAD|nr:hypothetical protein [Microbacterium sp. 4R-513]QIG39395.1 hypothetical protein G5T42_07785 [Microbacterium sp. 4R-513]